VLPFTSNFTPCGSGIGFFPIRDILLYPSLEASPSSRLRLNSTLILGC
jgi:hypothetical protein